MNVVVPLVIVVHCVHSVGVVPFPPKRIIDGPFVNIGGGLVDRFGIGICLCAIGESGRTVISVVTVSKESGWE